MNNIEKHPKSLRVFFASEMWERYGFYVVQTLLTLYLALYYKWPDKEIYALVGSFTALTYLSPVVGGWIADKLIGQKKAILLGALVLLVNYGFLSFLSGTVALTAALSGIAVGTGLLKPNISSLLGNEYPKSSTRRESGFTIFYMGITCGIILGTLLPSPLSKYFGWSAAFFSAAIGMIISFSVFAFGIKLYKVTDYNEHSLTVKNSLITLLLLTLLGALAFYILNSPQFANLIFASVVLFSSIYIFYSVSQESANQARQTLVIGLLCIISILFWAFYFQMFMSWTLFISRMVKPSLWGIEFPPPYYITIQSIGMLIIGYVLAKQHPQLTLMERALSTGRKFIYSMIFMSIAYGLLVLASTLNINTLLSPLLIIPAFLSISAAELFLSPTGLAAITLLADKNKVSTMVGIFFVSLGIGGFLSGKLAAFTAIPEGVTRLEVMREFYIAGFSQQLGILFLTTLGCFIIYAVIKFLLTRVKMIE
ncbi:MAG: MFS transporter [Legionella sp.]|nr:MAG: MFS transporter [Legionella sp.]PJD99202.1 MAG: MFS transporter [Legionella sp.]